MVARSQKEQAQNEFFGAAQPTNWGTTGGTGGTAAAPVPDASQSDAQVFTLNAATTVAAPVNPRTIGDKIFLVFVQDTTAGRTLAWNAIYRNAPTGQGGGATNGQRLSYEFRWDGVSWQGCGGSTAFA